MMGTSGPSVTGVQVVESAQQLVVFQTPPPFTARYAVLVTTGSKAMLLTRPLQFRPKELAGCGPREVKRFGSSDRGDRLRARLYITCPAGTPRGTRRSCS